MLSCLLHLSLFSLSEGLLPYAVQCQDSNGQSHPLPRSVCRPAAPLSPSRGPRHLPFPQFCGPALSIYHWTYSELKGWLPASQSPRRSGFESRASSQLSLQALPAPSSKLDTAVSVRHLRAGQRCRGPTRRPSVRPRKRPSP